MTFLGFPLEKVAFWAEMTLIAAGVVVALMTGLVFHLNGRVKTAEALASSTAIAEANRIAEEARADAAESNNLAMQAKLQLLEVQERLADRHLSTSQRAAFIKVLREAPGEIRIACAADRPEPCAFATELVSALTEAGWKIADFNRNAIFVGGSDPTPLVIHVNNTERVPTRAGVLQHAFKGAGFEAIAQVSADVPDGAVALLVKNKL